MHTIPRVVVEGLDLPRVLGEVLQAPIRGQPLTTTLHLGHLNKGVDTLYRGKVSDNTDIILEQ